MGVHFSNTLNNIYHAYVQDINPDQLPKALQTQVTIVAVVLT